ncbi:MAG: DUF4363 family protein [Clostridia bacterium]|nr:DUF4363 family protein [Clostridia bacterium]
MKRLIPASIIFVLVIVTYLTSLYYITDSCDKAKNLLENSVQTYTQQKTAEKQAKEMEDFWDKKEKVLSVFVNHDRIDDIEKAISLLNVYAKSPDNELFYEYADTVEILLHQIMEDTKITMHSIF